MKKKYFLLSCLLALLLMLSILPATAQVSTSASTSGFGAAVSYAQTIGNVAYVQTAGIGNADASAWAMTAVTFAESNIWTSGNAAAFSGAMATPFGSQAFVQLASFFDGMAMGSAIAGP